MAAVQSAFWQRRSARRAPLPGVPYYVARSYDDAVAKLREWEVL